MQPASCAVAPDEGRSVAEAQQGGQVGDLHLVGAVQQTDQGCCSWSRPVRARRVPFERHSPAPPRPSHEPL